MITLDNCPNIVSYEAFKKCEKHLLNYDNIYIGISGGADSQICLDLVLRVLRENQFNYTCKIRPAFFNTGIETQATKKHLDYLENKYEIKIERIMAKVPVAVGCKKYGVPFLSKYVSEMIKRLQHHNFDFLNDGEKTYKELKEKYNGCDVALKWWCNENGDKSSFNINRHFLLKEFMIKNPPDFFASPDCCVGSKKNPSKNFIKQNQIDLEVLGLRKFENGIRTQNISSCFTHKDGEVDIFRPAFWFTDKDKEDYKNYYNLKYSDCYEVWGMTRTGCAGCPFGSNFEEELRLLKMYEPNLHKAVCNIFGKSYEYTRKYRAFKEKHKDGFNKNQLSLFELIGENVDNE